MNQPLLLSGETCWRIEQAERMAVIIDAADYFVALKSALLQARRDVLLIGWDFDTRVELEPGEQSLDGPNRIGKLLAWLVHKRPDLRIRVLKWDLGMLQALGRGMLPIVARNLVSGKNLQLRLDGAHPAGSAHHQKIVVIDDVLAFCGGIDVTADRWDTREHLDDNPLRRPPGGAPQHPWHDVTTAVDGAAAKAIGELARARWKQATGEQLEPPEACDAIWPEPLEPDFREVDVAIARTMPEYEERAEVREIEALYLSGIAAARRTIYLESQYLASRRVAEGLAARLAEEDGPELILVLPCEIDSWLEHAAMDGARARLLHMLWRADRHGRFGAYFPVTEGGTMIYVHAKVMVIDDVLLRVGSSNLNNRSLGFDTECDLAVEAGHDDDAMRATISDLRDSLISEHLGVDTEKLAAVRGSCGGSLNRAIESLRDAGRSLRPFDPDEIKEDDSPLAENALLDPEGLTPSFEERLRRGAHSLATRIRRKK